MMNGIVCCGIVGCLVMCDDMWFGWWYVVLWGDVYVLSGLVCSSVVCLKCNVIVLCFGVMWLIL